MDSSTKKELAWLINQAKIRRIDLSDDMACEIEKGRHVGIELSNLFARKSFIPYIVDYNVLPPLREHSSDGNTEHIEYAILRTAMMLSRKGWTRWRGPVIVRYPKKDVLYGYFPCGIGDYVLAARLKDGLWRGHSSWVLPFSDATVFPSYSTMVAEIVSSSSSEVENWLTRTIIRDVLIKSADLVSDPDFVFPEIKIPMGETLTIKCSRVNDEIYSMSASVNVGMSMTREHRGPRLQAINTVSEIIHGWMGVE